MTIREAILLLLQQQDLDTPLQIRVNRRGANEAVSLIKVVSARAVSKHGQISIEERDVIKAEPEVWTP